MTDPFIHVVFFWLKEPQNAEHLRMFSESIHRFLENSQHAASWHIGTPAPTSRPVIDSTYTYSLIVTFASSEKQDHYQTEPAHLKFIEESSMLWERVQVYDSIETVNQESA
jgi:hypothetical protein